MLSGDIKNESGIALGQGAVAGECEAQIGASDRLYRLSIGSGSVGPVAMMWYKSDVTPYTSIYFFTFGITNFVTGNESFEELWNYIKQNGGELGVIQPPSERSIGDGVGTYSVRFAAYPASGVDLSGNNYQIIGLVSGYVNDTTSAKRIYIIGAKGDTQKYYIVDYIDSNQTTYVGHRVVRLGETEDATTTEAQSIPGDILDDQLE